MFRYERLSLFLIVLGVLIAIGTGVKAHLQKAEDPYLRFTSDPKASISCNIDGYTFTHTRETYSDGVIYTDGWWRNPLNPSVSMSAEAHGAGWASVLFYGNIDGKSYGDAEHSKPATQLGSWVDLLPLGSGGDHPISAGFTDNFNRSYKTYEWDASGSIKLVPVYWDWYIDGILPGGKWKEASSIHHDHGTASGGGSWLVEKNWTTLNRASPGNRSTPPSGGGSTPPTGSGSTPPGSTPPPPPTDNTPNCPDCTSHCSSPCNCTNSGTCNGTVVDNTPNCSGCTSHCSSPCSCSSGTCNGTVSPPPPPPPPPTPRTCSTERIWSGGTHKCDSAGSCSSTGNAFQSSCGRGRCRCSS